MITLSDRVEHAVHPPVLVAGLEVPSVLGRSCCLLKDG
jgi:hypothetical protein